MAPGRPSPTTHDIPSRPTGDIAAAPQLGADIAAALCRRWRDHHDIAAAQRLAAGHRHLVVKLAELYRGYGLPLEELAGEGHVGLMRAVCRFDPDRGVAFASYAAWWIRAAIQAYVLNSWSRAKLGTTTAQKALLLRLRQTRGRLRAFEDAPKPRLQLGDSRAKRQAPAQRRAAPMSRARRSAAPAEARPGLF
jgi:RNA polymerase sigma-32 factor